MPLHPVRIGAGQTEDYRIRLQAGDSVVFQAGVDEGGGARTLGHDFVLSATFVPSLSPQHREVARVVLSFCLPLLRNLY